MSTHTGTQTYAAYTEDRCSNEDTCPACDPMPPRRRCAKCGEAITTAMGQVVLRRDGASFTPSGRADLVACISCTNVLSDEDAALARQNGWTRSASEVEDNPMNQPCENCGAGAGQPCDYFCTAQPAANH